MTFRYHFGGVELCSEFPLAGLRPYLAPTGTVPRIDVVAGEGDPPPEDAFHFAWHGRFGMRLGEAGDEWRIGSRWGTFLIARDGSRVRMFGADEDAAVLQDFFARRLLPRLIKLKGGATYHAASLAKDGKGILMMGPSGAGKSTMTVGLAMIGGWDVLGDDMAIVWNDGVDRIAPAAAEVAIWPQTCTGLGLRDEQWRPLRGYDGKRSFHPRAPDRLDPMPLTGIFFLNRSEGVVPRVERRSRTEAFAQALKQIVFFNPSGPATEERVRSVSRLNTSLAEVPAWTLTYPASFSAFDAASDAMSAALCEAGARSTGSGV